MSDRRTIETAEVTAKRYQIEGYFDNASDKPNNELLGTTQTYAEPGCLIQLTYGTDQLDAIETITIIQPYHILNATAVEFALYLTGCLVVNLTDHDPCATNLTYRAAHHETDTLLGQPLNFGTVVIRCKITDVLS